MSRLVLTLFILLNAGAGFAQEPVRPDLLNKFWPAHWISHPDASASDWGIFHFRRSFRLDSVPERMLAQLSGDNRYRFFVNGTELVHGPSRGDLDHWHFETIDLAPYLRKGENTLAAVVWNFGRHRPVFQQSFQTAFLFLSDDPGMHFLNTGRPGWKVMANEAISPEREGIDSLHTYHVVGPGEKLDAARYPWNWEQPGFDDRQWATPRRLEQAHPGVSGTISAWSLLPRSLPMMEDRPERLQRIRRSSDISVKQAFLKGEQAIVVPAGGTLRILLDQGHLTNAYPVLLFSGGKGSRITLTYAEAMSYPDHPDNKGHRDSIEGKIIRGQQDIILPDGGGNRAFRPLWFRTYRYLQLEVQGGEEALTLHDLYGRYTGYPFEEKARFSSSDPSLGDIWNVGWRTARLCAGETYYDCPYYEQLQYVGDTRIQALISLYVSGDDRLMRQAIDAYDHSRIWFGLTHSRYPEGRPAQFIPPYSLFWVSMVHDYWLHRPDSAYVRAKMQGVQAVLHWFEQQVDPATGMLGELPYWNFVDWSWTWLPEEQLGGVPPLKGGSSILSLHFAYTLDAAAELCRNYGLPEPAARYTRLSAALKQRVWERCWDQRRGLLADTPDKQAFSQHANILGILTGALPEAQRLPVLEKTLSDTSLTQATFYFQFYLFEALRQTGLGERYLERLQPWRDMLAQGLSTFAENPEPTRSDCHAWSASPNYHLLSLVAGIRPAKAGFREVLIEPQPGSLNQLEARVPHPNGEIYLNLQRQGARNGKARIVLPAKTSGVFVWKGKKTVLREGEQEIKW